MKKIILSFCFIFCATLAMTAQGPGFANDVEDVAPIPGIALAMIVAVGIAVVKLRRNE